MGSEMCIRDRWDISCLVRDHEKVSPHISVCRITQYVTNHTIVSGVSVVIAGFIREASQWLLSNS